MAKTPYKMKGSPMERNFGAPFKKEKLTKVTDEKGKAIKPGPKPPKPPKKDEVTTTYNKDGSYTKSKGEKSTTYIPNPNYKPEGKPGRNYKYITGEKNPDGSPVGE